MGQLGDWFEIITGVRQGCLLSPLLFIIVMDWILKQAVDNDNCGIHWLEGHRLADLDFADDIALFDETWRGMQQLTNKIEEVACKVGLYMNTGKTKLTKVGTFEETGTMQVGGGSIEEVEKFCYLGSVISRGGSCDKDIRTRLGKANTTFGRLSNLWKNKKLNLQVKVRLYESLVLSTLQYSSETWSMTVANRKKLEAAHHKWMRRILGITWKQMVTNEEVRKITGMGTLEVILRRNRLRWLGHIHRMDDNRLAKQVLNWIPKEGRKKRGRPRKNWRATVTEDLKKMNMIWEDAEEIAGDRTAWRSCVARCAAGTRTD